MVDRFRIPPGYWRRFAAGAAFGIYMSHLLYYLNPQIEITSTKLTLINLGYGLYCGLLFGTILWSLRLVRRRFLPPEEFRPHGFGIMTFVTWFTAFVFWGHYLTLRIYLPVPAVRNLKRATITIGVVAFLLFVLWLFERTARKRISQIIFIVGCVLLLGAGFLLHQRRQAFLFPEREKVVLSIDETPPTETIVVIALHSVAHDWLIELEAEQTLPFFHDRQEDFFTRIEPFPTTSSRSIWASLTTGKLPYRHGVAAHYSWMTPLNPPGKPYLLLPKGVAFGVWGLLPPVTREVAPLPSGNALPVWSIFERVGRGSQVLSWPGMPPGESRSGSDQNATASPRYRLLEHHAEPVRRAVMADTALIDQALGIVRDDAPALLMLSLQGIATIESEFGLEGNALPAPSSFEGQAVRTWLEEIGSALEGLEEVTTAGLLVVVSPTAVRPHYAPDDIHSYIQSRLRPHAGDADGFILIKGAGTVHRRGTAAASVTDLVPTLLFASGLPVARDMDGRVLSEGFGPDFVRRTQLLLVPSYDVRRLEVRH